MGAVAIAGVSGWVIGEPVSIAVTAVGFVLVMSGWMCCISCVGWGVIVGLVIIVGVVC